MSVRDDIQDTLNSSGAKHIIKALRSYHKSQWRKLKDCTPDQLREIQSVMKAIDTALPLIVEKLMNQHLDGKKDKDPSLWFKFSDFIKKFRHN